MFFVLCRSTFVIGHQQKAPSPLVGTRARAPVVPPGLACCHGRHRDDGLRLAHSPPTAIRRLAAPVTLGVRDGLLATDHRSRVSTAGSGANFFRFWPDEAFSPQPRLPVGFPLNTLLRHSLSSMWAALCRKAHGLSNENLPGQDLAGQDTSISAVTPAVIRHTAERTGLMLTDTVQEGGVNHAGW